MKPIIAPDRYVISLFDYTGNAVRDWAAAGYKCYCYDIQHPKFSVVERVGAGSITYVYADLEHNSTFWQDLERTWRHLSDRLDMIFGFPPCDDMAVSGAKHFKRKLAENPDVQANAVKRAVQVETLANRLNSRPFVIENPRSILSTLWRKPDHKFDPYNYGGYLPHDDQHPRWPTYIAPRDAYTKDTWLWMGNGAEMPPRASVEPEILERVAKSGRTIRGSRQFMKLGGSSMKTKNIRNATPRGFARAFFLSNSHNNFMEKVA